MKDHHFELDPRRLVLCGLLFLVACACFLTGCHMATATTPPTAPTDPYATALSHLNVFSQALVDAKKAAIALHTTQIVSADGTVSTVLDDATYARVNTGMNFLAAEGTKLSDLLAVRASSTRIAAEMAAMTAGLTAQLSPEAVGVKNPASQAKYVIVTNVISFALNTVASYVALIPASEASNGFSRDRRPSSAPQHPAPLDPHSDRTGAEGSPSLAAGRPFGTARPGEREFRRGAWLLAVRLA